VGSRELAQVDECVGAEVARQLEPLVDAVDHDHSTGAHLARHRARVDAKPARALDDDRLAGLEIRDSSPAYTCVYAQFTPAAISSVISGGNRNIAWLGRR